MIYAPTAEQQALRATLAEVLASTSNPRESFDGGPAIDGVLWGQLAELGVVGLLINEDLGGSAGSIFDALVLAEQIGAYVAPVPVVTPNVAALLLDTAIEGAPTSELSRALASGESIVLAGISARNGFDTGLRAVLEKNIWTVSGALDDAIEAACAAVVIVVADSSDGPRVLAVELDQPQVNHEDLGSLDATQRLASIVFIDAVATDLGPLSPAVLARCEAVAWTLLAAQAVGAASSALELTSGYVKDRRQFGQPIGRFQAVKHRVTNMLIDVENARSAVYNAGWALAESRDDAQLAAHLAKAASTEKAVNVTQSAIQAHGGIGFTWEYDLHLYLRRAKTCELVLGQPDEHFAAIAQAILPAATLEAEGARR